MGIRSYQFFCGNCGYKRFTKGDDVQDLVEIKTSPIARGGPALDPLTKKAVTPPSIQQCKKFKCPKCGYVIKAKQLKDLPDEQTNRIDGCEGGTKGQSIPGDLT